jgi:hypothetical protein
MGLGGKNGEDGAFWRDELVPPSSLHLEGEPGARRARQRQTATKTRGSGSGS